ncbi:aldo/keto reductase [Weissella confusa]|uniref:Aldo/keto reductase n=1 Tax=Weissella confusa TaxID=1583 RepID=A0A923NGE7_WEICO|nr:aldo/keto reductase [Weissella confusa]
MIDSDIHVNMSDERSFDHDGGILAYSRLKNMTIQAWSLGPRYDFSKSHLISAVDEELKRLQTDYLDVFLLHRPDTLMDPEQVAEAFDELQAAGKVKHFGTSNMIAQALVEKALEKDVNFFDTADIYAAGKSSVVLGQALKDAGVNREDIFLQSKGGIILEDGQISGDGWMEKLSSRINSR